MTALRRWVGTAAAIAASCAALPARAQAEALATASPPRPEGALEVLPGASREINHAHSASRDTGAMGWALTPYSVLSAGADVAILKWKLAPVSLRFGFFGLLELESDRPYEGDAKDFIPRENSAFWRAHGGYSVAASFERWARQTLGERGAFEVCLSLRHESEHFTGSTSGDEPKYGDLPMIGNFLMADAGVRLPLGDFDLELRLQTKLWLGERAYSVGPGGDAILRWNFTEWLVPFSATFAEYLFGRQTIWDDGRNVQVPDNYLVRNLTGVAFPGTVGEIQVFNALEIGHGKGFNVYHEQVRWGFGVRLAFY